MTNKRETERTRRARERIRENREKQQRGTDRSERTKGIEQREFESQLCVDTHC